MANPVRWTLLFFAAFFICFAGITLAAPKGGGGKGGGSDPATIKFTFSGEIIGSMICENKLNADSRILGCNKGGGFTFYDSILANIQENIECFPEMMGYNGGLYTDGTIQVFDDGDSSEAYFRFWGKGDGGVNDVLYVLEAHDLTGWDETFPPVYGVATTMTTDDPGFVILRTANKRQEKDARRCLDGFPESAIIDVSVTRLTE